MPIAYLYWLFFILLAICTCPRPLIQFGAPWYGWLFMLGLFAILGWREFGSMIK